MARKKKPEIRSVYKPPEREYLDLKHVYTRKQHMAEARAKFERQWDKWEKQYEAYRTPKDEDDWRSNIVIPTTAAIVEAQLSEIIDQNMRPRVVARGVEDKPKAVVMNAVIDYTWEVGRADVEVYKLVKDALVFGTGIAQEYYRREKRMVKRLVEVDPKKGEIWKEEEIKDFDDVYLEAVKLQDFYIDEKARSFNGSYPAKDCIRRYVMRYDEFRNFFKGPIWDPMGRAKLVKPGGDTDYYEFYKPPEGKEKDNLVEVLWYWSVASTPGNPDIQDNLIIVANDVCIRRGPMPYDHKRLPFVRAVDILRSHQFYGKGEAELLESIQEEQTTLRRMVIDRNHLDIDKGFLVSNRETELDEEDLISRPHMMIPVEDPSNVTPLEYGDVPRSVFISLEMLRDDAIRITGYDDRMLSVQKPGSATEAAILKEATLKRLRAKLWLLRNLCLYQVGALRESNIRQFYTVPKIEKVVGDKTSREYRAEIRRAYRLGRLRMKGGEPYVEKYRTIRLENKKLIVTDEGNIEVQKHRGPTYFEVAPELITPYYGSFDVKIEPTPTVPISKPLQQERASMMFDRLAQFPDIYDPEKLGDWLAEEHDIDPDSLKRESSLAERFESSIVSKSVDLATVENEELLSGKEIPPTPMATEPHTEVHIALIESPQVMDLPPDSPILANIVRHIVGELQAQQQRAQAAQPVEMAGGAEEYRPPSGPSAVKKPRGNSAVPAIGEREQIANIMGEMIK